MQRTIKTTRFTYAVTSLKEDGNIAAELRTIEVLEANADKALRKAMKEVGPFSPLKVETVEALYKLDDDIFMKYAVKVGP